MDNKKKIIVGLLVGVIIGLMSWFPEVGISVLVCLVIGYLVKKVVGD